MLKAESIHKKLKAANLDEKTESRLRLALDVVSYARTTLKMKSGGSYEKFIDVGRPWVTQIVMAAHKNELKSFEYDYPVVGKMPYKGFFEEADAIQEQERLRALGYDTFRRPVRAFSSIGWMSDPLLSTMMGSESELVEVLLHELTHTTFYFEGQADFNEAFATWFGHRAAELYFRAKKTDAIIREKLLKENEAEYEKVKKLGVWIPEILAEGERRYRESKDVEKTRTEYFVWISARLKQLAPADRWHEGEWNNARLLSFGTYYKHIPQIEQYAKAHNLGPAEFLERVLSRGSGIIAEILTSQASAVHGQ